MKASCTATQIGPSGHRPCGKEAPWVARTSEGFIFRCEEHKSRGNYQFQPVVICESCGGRGFQFQPEASQS